MQIVCVFVLSFYIFNSLSSIDGAEFIKLGTYAGVDDEGISYTKTYYVPKDVTATWIYSRKICLDHNYDIASFETRAEADSFIKVCNSNFSLIGDLASIGGISLTPLSKRDWYWVNSGKRVTYELPFLSTDPNFYGGGEWGLALGTLTDCRFTDMNIDSSMYKKKFICQEYTRNVPVKNAAFESTIANLTSQNEGLIAANKKKDEALKDCTSWDAVNNLKTEVKFMRSWVENFVVLQCKKP